MSGQVEGDLAINEDYRHTHTPQALPVLPESAGRACRMSLPSGGWAAGQNLGRYVSTAPPHMVALCHLRP